MAATTEESLASLRLLVTLAKADGVLHEQERHALESALAEYEPAPHGLDKNIAVGLLLGEDSDLDELLAEIQSEEARLQAYGAAYAIAHADGDCSPQEAKLLDRIRETFAITSERQQYLERVFQPKPPAGPAASRMFEGVERRHKVEAETRKASIIAALLGAFPIPVLAIATDLAVVALQVSLAKDIGSFHGREMDTDKTTALMATFGAGNGARIALTNLLKVFPGWGAAVGAGLAYASTYAVGRVMDQYFEEGGGDPNTLKARFNAAVQEGKKAYRADEADIEAKAQASKERLAELGQQLEAGEITQAEFEHKATELAG